ncbi:MAG: DUF1566 domain-containing protein, partial [Acidiferrobacterales bacterium]|nr:DUF1566 domain-containing protein [Acidiferrobacterales bacterium]
DRLTGLVWLDATECAQKKSWGEALELAANMFDGATSDDIDTGGDCGLTDGSIEGDWRIPNLFEVLSLMDISEVRNPTFYQGYHGEPVSFENFSKAGFPSEMVLTWGTFWTSTTVGNNTTAAYTIGLSFKDFFVSQTKTDEYQVLMVRDPN